MFVDGASITIPIAIAAGFISFVSPCVLPLVPAYIGYLTGQAANTMSSTLVAAEAEGVSSAELAPSRWAIFLHGVFFVLGFAIIFVFLGISAGAIGQAQRLFLRNLDIVLRIGGLLIIVLGLHTMGVIRIPFLYYDTRNQQPPRQELGYFGSVIMGMTFSAGWSPCLGPFLAGMLTLGASTGSVTQAAVLLFFYAMGLGIPFLGAALLMEQSTGLMRSLQKHMKVIEIISGILLIAIGVLVFTGLLQRYFAPLAGGTDLTIMLDEWLVNVAGLGQ